MNFGDTGNTLKKATNLVEGVFGIKPEAIQLYQDLPVWYKSNHLGIAGVKEADLFESGSGKYHDMVDLFESELIDRLLELVDKYEAQVLIRLMKKVTIVSRRTNDPEEMLKIIKGVEAVNVEDLRTLDAFLNDPANYFTFRELEGLVEYLRKDYRTELKSVFNTIASRLDNQDQQKNFVAFRKTLKALVDEYFKQARTT